MVRWRDAWARYGPVPGATAMAGWALLPLRAFLGFTFTFAGLQKLANPGFFDSSNPASIQSQLTAAARRSPIHALVGHLVHVAVPLGVIIAMGELAIGVATIVGLWTRIAAGAGMLLSFGLFLTISFHSSPYYTGSDIVFVFAWTPLLVAGAGGVLCADAWSRDVAHRDAGAGRATLVPLPFETVQEICGFHNAGKCRAMKGQPCDPAPCPYLARGPHTAPRTAQDAIDRRAFTLRTAAAGAVAAVTVLGAGLAAGLGRLVGGATSRPGAPSLGAGSGSSTSAGSGATTAPTSAPTTSASASSTADPPTSAPSTTQGALPSGTRIGAASVVPVGGAASFQDPSSGDPGLVVQPTAGKYLAFDAVCPHAGCIVQFSGSDRKFVCPCHGSVFNLRTGAVELGPATTGLSKITIAEGPDGQLYVS